MYRRYDFSNSGENETSRLRSHPLNDKIYGSPDPDEDLQKSVKENGVFNPIIINRKKEILSGNRRWRAAIKAGFKKIPVITLLSEGADGLLGELFLIESNRQREKTRTTRGRECIELLRIEKELAKERQRKGASEKVPAKGPEAGESMAKAAKKTGVGGANTARKLIAVIGAADGGSEKAKKALEAIDARGLSILGAYRKVVKPKNPEKISAGVLEARQLTNLFKNGEVTRSKRGGLFHVMIRDVTPEQVRKLARGVKWLDKN